MKMARHAEQVEVYEMNSLINQNIVKQRQKNAKLMEECMFNVLYRKIPNTSCGLIFVDKTFRALLSVRANLRSGVLFFGEARKYCSSQLPGSWGREEERP